MFDLWTQGKGNDVANDINPGDTCLVACHQSKSKIGKKFVVMEKYVYIGKRQVDDASAPGGRMWVLEGRLEEREILPKAEAAAHPLYSRFFSKVGHFKQISVLRDA